MAAWESVCLTGLPTVAVEGDRVVFRRLVPEGGFFRRVFLFTERVSFPARLRAAMY